MTHERISLDWLAARFDSHRALAETLLPYAIDPSADDGAHDFAHLSRVWANARQIADAEGGDGEVLTAAVLLHDCVAIEKQSPQRAQASRFSAARASDILGRLNWPRERCAAVAHAIEAHSFSAGIEPLTLEARIVQDADRLDALGLIGVARCFYTAGRMGTSLYDPADPAAKRRATQDKRYALDHFSAKLLRLSEGFRTGRGASMAAERHQRLLAFYDDFLAEVQAD